MTSEEPNAPVRKAEIVYSKAQILAMERYRKRIDLLAVLLDEKKSYRHEDVAALLSKFEKRRVT